MRTVNVTATVRLTLKVDEGVDIGDIISGLAVVDPLNNSAFDIEDAGIESYEITDSR